MPDRPGGDATALPDLAEALAKLGFAVPAQADEYALEKARYLAHRDDPRRLYLTLAPTMQCNMKCSYCFQQNVEHSRAMTPAIAKGVVEFARRKAETAQGMVVQWFGGEPLMA